MSQEYNGYTIPAYTDVLDGPKAFQDYTDDVITKLANKANSASPTFTGTVTGTGATFAGFPFLGAQNFLHVRDEQAANTNGGTFTSGAWRTRVLNTTKTNAISGASLASDQVSLPAGTYFANAHAPASYCQGNKIRLYNVTGAASLLIGSSEYGLSDADPKRSFLSGLFTLSSTSTVELQHYCTVTRNNDGLGVPANVGVVEVYAELMIWKVS